MTTNRLGTVNRQRLIDMALDVTRAHLPDRHEGLRAEVVADYLVHPKIDVHVDPALPGRPNVIARIKGTGKGPGLLLNGHLDGGFVEKGWKHDPIDPWQEGDLLYGGAISDMYGGVATMMETMLMAAEAGGLPGDLVYLANMYHDSNGLGTKYALASEADWPEYGINGEPTSSGILTTHGGCVKFAVEFTGRIAHVSRSEEGKDALSAAVDVYQALRTADWTHEPDADLSQHPRFVVGVLQAGVAPGAVPDTATLQGDIRTVPSQSWHTVRADLERVIRDTVGDRDSIGTKVRCIVRQRAFVGPKSGRLFDALSGGHRDVYGSPPPVNAEKAAQSFVTDAVDMHFAGIETLVYGPGSWHFAPDESISIDEMTKAAQVYLATAHRLMDVH
jgi:acetylornithine deacetylase/succinyl-diaminopimelate desuccinylase-like protein